MSGTRTAATFLLHQVQHGISHPPIELIYSPHEFWPLPRLSTLSLPRPISILVLDSSFNPPTLAHLALANTRRPYWPHFYPETQEGRDISDYDAKLLLLSVRNADKTLKPGDATYIQRLEMMNLLAKDIPPQGGAASNVAIAIVDEPTFVGKSTILQSFFKSRFTAWASASLNTPIYDTQLTFLLGLDTLTRLVQPRYYSSHTHMLSSLRKFFSPPPDGDDSSIVYARRGFPEATQSQNIDPSQGADLASVREFISLGRITLIDIDADLRSYSSSEVRDTIANLGLDACEWKKFVTPQIATYISSEKLYTSHF